MEEGEGGLDKMGGGGGIGRRTNPRYTMRERCKSRGEGKGVETGIKSQVDGWGGGELH